MSGILCLPNEIHGQSDSLLNRLLQEEQNNEELLPKKMLLTQRLLWGRKGIARITGLAPLGTEQRKKELNIRRAMLTTHQVLGFITLGGMVAQGVVGGQLYNGKYNLRSTHEMLGKAVTITYSLSASMSRFAPPPLINRDKKISSIRIHKWLSIVHMSGMIATNILGNAIKNNPELKPVHRAVAYTTFATYAGSIIAIKF
jgi:hypothetical protein